MFGCCHALGNAEGQFHCRLAQETHRFLVALIAEHFQNGLVCRQLSFVESGENVVQAVLLLLLLFHLNFSGFCLAVGVDSLAAAQVLERFANGPGDVGSVTEDAADQLAEGFLGVVLAGQVLETGADVIDQLAHVAGDVLADGDLVEGLAAFFDVVGEDFGVELVFAQVDVVQVEVFAAEHNVFEFSETGQEATERGHVHHDRVVGRVRARHLRDADIQNTKVEPETRAAGALVEQAGLCRLVLEERLEQFETEELVEDQEEAELHVGREVAYE